jgi:hypothetical protein
MATDIGATHTVDLTDDDLDRQLTLAFQRGEKDAYRAIQTPRGQGRAGLPAHAR